MPPPETRGPTRKNGWTMSCCSTNLALCTPSGQNTEKKLELGHMGTTMTASASYFSKWNSASVTTRGGGKHQ